MPRRYSAASRPEIQAQGDRDTRPSELKHCFDNIHFASQSVIGFLHPANKKKAGTKRGFAPNQRLSDTGLRIGACFVTDVVLWHGHREAAPEGLVPCSPDRHTDLTRAPLH